MKNALEALIGSLGLTVFGFITIPLVGSWVGAEITSQQGALMGLIFFALRFFWLLGVRLGFQKFIHKNIQDQGTLK